MTANMKVDSPGKRMVIRTDNGVIRILFDTGVRPMKDQVIEGYLTVWDKSKLKVTGSQVLYDLVFEMGGRVVDKEQAKAMYADSEHARFQEYRTMFGAVKDTLVVLPAGWWELRERRPFKAVLSGSIIMYCPNKAPGAE